MDGGFCFLKLPSLSQFWTFTPNHSDDNSFLGYSVRSFRQHTAFESQDVLGKEYKFFTESLRYIRQLSKFTPTHATAMAVPPRALAGVQNHGVLDPDDLQKKEIKTCLPMLGLQL